MTRPIVPIIIRPWTWQGVRYLGAYYWTGQLRSSVRQVHHNRYNYAIGDLPARYPVPAIMTRVQWNSDGPFVVEYHGPNYPALRVY